MPIREDPVLYNTSRRGFLGHTLAGSLALGFTRSAVAQTKGPIRVGVIVTLSGPIVTYGRAEKAGAEIGSELINQNAGVDGRPLEIIVRDDKGSPTEAVAQVRDLLGQGVNLFIGGVFTPNALAISSIMPDANALYISTAAFGDSLTHEAFNNHYFRVTENATMRYKAIAAAVARANPGVKRWGAIIPDQEGSGLSLWRAFKEGMRISYPSLNNNASPEFVDPVFYKVGATDFKAQISTAMRLSADGLFINSNIVTFWQQAKLLGLESAVKVIAEAGTGNTIAKALGKNSPNEWNSDHWNFHSWIDRNALAKQFYDAWVAKTGDKEPLGYIAPPYSALLALTKAIKTSGSTDTGVLIKTLEGMSFDTVKGPSKFRKEDHQALCSVDVFKIGPAQNEQGWAVTDSISVDASDLAEPPTPGKPLANK
jgi:branched-chain amino acid transport system substrate-binding protein